MHNEKCLKEKYLVSNFVLWNSNGAQIFTLSYRLSSLNLTKGKLNAPHSVYKTCQLHVHWNMKIVIIIIFTIFWVQKRNSEQNNSKRYMPKYTPRILHLTAHWQLQETSIHLISGATLCSGVECSFVFGMENPRNRSGRKSHWVLEKVNLEQ